MGRSLQYAGVAAVAVIWSTLIAAALLTGFDVVGEHAVSYLGTGGSGTALFTTGLLVSAVLLATFHQLVRFRYPVGFGFSFFMLVGLAGQMVAAIVPIGGDPGVHRIHTTSALVLGASLPLLMWRFAAGQEPGPWRRLCYRLFFAEGVACAVGVYLSARSVAPVAEILPAAVFHVWVFVLTFSTAGAGHESPPPLRLSGDGTALGATAPQTWAEVATEGAGEAGRRAAAGAPIGGTR